MADDYKISELSANAAPASTSEVEVLISGVNYKVTLANIAKGLDPSLFPSAVPITKGGTGQDTAQEAIDALTQVASATNEYVLTKDTSTGNAIWKVSSGGGGGDGKVYFIFPYEGVRLNGTYPVATIPIAGTISKLIWTSAILPVGSARTRDIRKNGTLSTDSIITDDAPLSIATTESATNGKYTVSTTALDNGAVAVNDVLYETFAGGSTSGTADDCLIIEITPS